jgi:hypothetical protein
VDYFEDNFIGRPIRNDRRRTLRYSIYMWNCYSRLENQLARTNNSSEGCVREHPSIYESIKDLQMEQHSTLILAEQLWAGLVKLRKHTSYELLDEKLQVLVSTFHVITTDIYFKRAWALFNFWYSNKLIFFNFFNLFLTIGSFVGSPPSLMYKYDLNIHRRPVFLTRAIRLTNATVESINNVMKVIILVDTYKINLDKLIRIIPWRGTWWI